MASADRETRKELRRRGNTVRTVDLDDLVLELPPQSGRVTNKTSDDRTLHAIPVLAPPEIVSQAEQRIIAKHKQMVEERLSQRQLDNGSRKTSSKSAANINTSQEVSSVKHSQGIRKPAVVKSKAIRIKYNRVPSNKTKLIYIDVIAQMVKDYIREQQHIEKFIETVKTLQKEEVKKRKAQMRRKSNKAKNLNEEDKLAEDSPSIIKRNCQNAIKEYYDRVNEYFSSIIDLQLSTSLIRNDLTKINAEKNSLRMEIFKIRQQRGEIGLEMKQTRNEIKHLTSEYSKKELLYKELLALKQDDHEVEEQASHSAVVEQINYKLDRMEEFDPNDAGKLLALLRQVNSLLEAKKNGGSVGLVE